MLFTLISKQHLLKDHTLNSLLEFTSFFYPATWFFLAFYCGKYLSNHSKYYVVLAFILLGLRSLVWTFVDYFYLDHLEYQEDPSTVFMTVNVINLVLFISAVLLLFFGLKPQRDTVFAQFKQQKETVMTQSTGSVMKYLLSSAFLNGSSYRTRVKNFYGSYVKLPAPESGINVPLLLAVCNKLDKRDFKYDLIFSALIFMLIIYVGSVIDSRGGEDLTALGLVLFWLTSSIVLIYKTVGQRRQTRKYFVNNDFDEEAFKKDFIGDSLPECDFKQDGNIVIYDGFRPFVGSGIDLDGWSISIDLSKKKDEELSNAKPVDKNYGIDELYDLLRNNLRSLGFSNLSIKDLLFVNGQDAKDIDWLLPNKFEKPLSSVDDTSVKRFYDAKNKAVRHYCQVQVSDWENNIILSFYIRFSLQKNNLFVETSRFLLTPISANYREVDKVANRNFTEKLAHVQGLLLLGGPYAAYSGLKLVGRMYLGLFNLFSTEAGREAKEIKRNPQFNYGSQTSLRESLSGGQYMHYFQMLDKELYFKTLERCFLDTVVTFLDDHNIDTSDFVERRTTIINSGIIVKGGDINTDSLAVGNKAKANSSKS